MKKYFKHKIKSLLVINKIVVIHFLNLNEQFNHEEEAHDFWELVCPLKGNITCTANGNPVNVQESYLNVHKPYEKHSLEVKGGQNAEVFVISFECLSEAMRFFADKKIKLNARQLKQIRQIVEIAKKTYDITFYNLDTENMCLLPQPTLGGEQLIKNLVETLLIDIMRTLTETDSGNDVFLQEDEINNKLAEMIIKILKDNVCGKLSINDISRQINYSKAHIFKQFKSSTNKCVMEYYLELKIQHAKELLKKNQLSVKEISELLCFDTPNYFSKTFKKVVGLTPTQYKKHASM